MSLPRVFIASSSEGLPEAQALYVQVTRLVEGLRKERTLRAEVDRLAKDGQRLLERRRFAEAQVAFERALALEPGNLTLQEQSRRAEELSSQTLIERLMPNEKPQLEILEPAQRLLGKARSLLVLAGHRRLPP